MTTDERVRWIAARVTRLGITRDTPAALGITRQSAKTAVARSAP
jgi:hypothetical protein